MDKLLQTIYKCFYTPKLDEELIQVAETNHRELIKRLSKGDRRRVLRIIDAKDALAERQSIDRFICGFQLATQLAIELGCYEKELVEFVPLGHTLMTR